MAHYLNCPTCKKEFKVKRNRLKTAKWCSKKCQSEYIKSKPLVGIKNNRLTVLEEVENEVQYNCGKPTFIRKIRCICDCGKTVIVRLTSFRTGYTKSCGCLTRENDVINLSNISHNLSKHPLYHVWGGIIQRCYNKKSPAYRNYGARGVRVCDEWRYDFKAFYDWCISNGWNSKLEIDKDAKGDGLLYSSDTCSMFTSKQNNRNRRDNRYVLINNLRVTIIELSETTGIKKSFLLKNLPNGINITNEDLKVLHNNAS
jgi:hypothetical protein